MSEPIRKITPNPESYSPKNKPEISLGHWDK